MHTDPPSILRVLRACFPGSLLLLVGQVMRAFLDAIGEIDVVIAKVRQAYLFQGSAEPEAEYFQLLTRKPGRVTVR